MQIHKRAQNEGNLNSSFFSRHKEKSMSSKCTRNVAWQQYLKRKAKRRIRSRRKVLNVVELKYKLMQSHLMPQFHHHLLRFSFTVHF